jgi:hypothetical protein
MSDPSEKKFRYEITLQYSGTVEVYPEPDDDDETIAEYAFDEALSDALAGRRYDVIDYEVEEVKASV